MRTLTPGPTKIALLVALTTIAGATPLLALSSPADEPEVKAQIDLFSTWVEGQIAIRGLPGVVVGVVSDQDLIWAKGFGDAAATDEYRWRSRRCCNEARADRRRVGSCVGAIRRHLS